MYIIILKAYIISRIFTNNNEMEIEDSQQEDEKSEVLSEGYKNYLKTKF